MLGALKQALWGGDGGKPSLPLGLRLYAIGDVHGRADLLRDLLARIEADDARRAAADTQIILLGDLIDRGPDSAAVVDLAIRIVAHRPSTRVLLGNHEEVFLRLYNGDIAALPFFLQIGGRETLMSYGLDSATIGSSDDAALLATLRARVPAAHIAFLRGCEDMVIAGDYAFVHAGVKPGVALAEQVPGDLRWIRKPFLTHSGAFDRMIVHGHSITEAVDERANRIGIDTGAFYSGKLTAIGLEGADRWYLSTGDA